MNANELRIGNLIQKNDEICEVSSIHSDSTIRIFNDDKTDTFGCFALRIFNPIPLTEELLLNFGFEKDDVFDKIFTYLPLHDLCMDKLSFRKSEGFICYYGIKYRTLLKHIQYVHQLQNLYFALTGEELVVSDAVS